MYKITAKNLIEIRMGSPFNAADLEITGEFVPDLRNYIFQDKFAISNDGCSCVLVQWDTKSNEPGFILWFIDEESRLTKKSEKIVGCCNDIMLTNKKAVVEVWNYNHKTKSDETARVEIQFS